MAAFKGKPLSFSPTVITEKSVGWVLIREAYAPGRRPPRCWRKCLRLPDGAKQEREASWGRDRRRERGSVSVWLLWSRAGRITCAVSVTGFIWSRGLQLEGHFCPLPVLLGFEFCSLTRWHHQQLYRNSGSAGRRHIQVLVSFLFFFFFWHRLDSDIFFKWRNTILWPILISENATSQHMPKNSALNGRWDN